MKKKILLIISIVVTTFSFAQTQPKYGIRAGITSTSMSGNAVDNFNNLLDFSKGNITTKDHTGFFAGTYVIIPVSENFSIEPGVYYSQKGYELNGALNLKGLDFLGANAKAVLQSQYIDVPVMLKANFNGLQIFAGPQFSYLVKSNLKTTASILGINLLNHTTDATSQFNRWDAGLTGGIGYQFANGMNVMASYDYGLTKVDANNNVKAYNRGIKLGIGLNL